jgi:hypothetical protein
MYACLYCWIIPAGSRAFCLLTFASCCNFYSTLLQNELNWVEKRKNKPRFVSFHFRERFARKETETCYSCNVWQALQVSKILPCHRCDWNRYTCLVPTLLVVRGVKWQQQEWNILCQTRYIRLLLLHLEILLHFITQFFLLSTELNSYLLNQRPSVFISHKVAKVMKR